MRSVEWLMLYFLYMHFWNCLSHFTASFRLRPFYDKKWKKKQLLQLHSYLDVNVSFAVLCTLCCILFHAISSKISCLMWMDNGEWVWKQFIRCICISIRCKRLMNFTFCFRNIFLFRFLNVRGLLLFWLLLFFSYLSACVIFHCYVVWCLIFRCF